MNRQVSKQGRIVSSHFAEIILSSAEPAGLSSRLNRCQHQLNTDWMRETSSVASESYEMVTVDEPSSTRALATPEALSASQQPSAKCPLSSVIVV